MDEMTLVVVPLVRVAQYWPGHYWTKIDVGSMAIDMPTVVGRPILRPCGYG